jgi:membrane protein DedA with SNARE-associated domain/rhodanese-related sulfurtransferase
MQQIVGVLNQYGALVVFVWVLLARLGLPLPSVPLIVVAGALTVSGKLAIVAVLGASVSANLIAEAAWFQAGRHYGYRGLQLLCRLSLSPDLCVRQSEAVVSRWGGLSLVAAKFLPGVSLLAAPMSGALGMKAGRFIGFQLLGSTIWSLAFLLLGRVGSRQIARLLDVMSDAGMAAAVALALVVIAWLGGRYWRRKASQMPGVARVSVAELRDLIRSGRDPAIIDVRSVAAQQMDRRRIAGAYAIPLENILTGTASFSKERHIVLYCDCPYEASAAKAAEIMRQQGFQLAKPLAGGIEAWLATE